MGQAFLAGFVWENAVLGAQCSSSSLLAVGLTEAAILFRSCRAGGNLGFSRASETFWFHSRLDQTQILHMVSSLEQNDKVGGWGGKPLSKHFLSHTRVCTTAADIRAWESRSLHRRGSVPCSSVSLADAYERSRHTLLLARQDLSCRFV